MNTIVLCLVVCNFAVLAFFSIPWLMVRRSMMNVSPALNRKEAIGFELALAVCFLLMLALVSPLLANLAEGYAALYVQEVGWWTL